MMTITTKAQSASLQIDMIEGQDKVLHPNGLNGTYTDNIQIVPPPDDRADLPTFPMDVGWRQRYDPETGICHRSPLTLLDLLYPTEDDIGVVTMAQSYLHDFWLNFLVALFRGYLAADKWLVTSDVLIFWHRGSATPLAPDIAVMAGGKEPDEKDKSYHVGKHGPIPEFVLEITSRETRDTDLNTKRLAYAAMGVREYLIIDIETPRQGDWALLGYRLGDTPYYEPITPDAEGGLTFETIGFRFTIAGRSQIAVYNAESGEQLLSINEQQLRAKRAEEAAQSEAAARQQAEEAAQSEAMARQQAEEENASTRAENEELRAEMERLKAQIAQKNS